MRYERDILVHYSKYLSNLTFCNDFLKLLKEIEELDYKIDLDSIVLRFCNLVSNTDKEKFKFYLIEDCDLFYLSFVKIHDCDAYYVGIINYNTDYCYIQHYINISTVDIRILLQFYVSHKNQEPYSTRRSKMLLKYFITNYQMNEYFQNIYNIVKYSHGRYFIFKIIPSMRKENIFILLFDKKEKSISFQYFDRCSNYFKPYFDKKISYYLFDMDDFLYSQCSLRHIFKKKGI